MRRSKQVSGDRYTYLQVFRFEEEEPEATAKTRRSSNNETQN